MNPAGPEPFASTWSRWFFAAFILFALYMAYRLVEPYLIPIFLAVVLVVVAGPLYQLVLKLVGRHRALASMITCLLLFLIIAVPLFLVASAITTQALNLATTVGHLLGSDQLKSTFEHGLGRLGPYMERLQDTFGISHADVVQNIGQWVRKISNLIYGNLTFLLRGMTSLVVDFALMLFVTFYLLMDGQDFARKIMALSPLPEETNRDVVNDVLNTLRATLKGSVVLALIQGAAGGLGFWVFGVPNALFWGTVMVFASVVPLVGTALVWMPAGIYLIMMNQTGQALGVMVWCLMTGMAGDNWLRPKLIGGHANLHPLLTFFSVLGGLSLFGVVGLFLGPLILAVVLSLLEVYQRYFLPAQPEQFCEPAAGEKPDGDADK